MTPFRTPLFFVCLSVLVHGCDERDDNQTNEDCVMVDNVEVPIVTMNSRFPTVYDSDSSLSLNTLGAHTPVELVVTLKGEPVWRNSVSGGTLSFDFESGEFLKGQTTFEPWKIHELRTRLDMNLCPDSGWSVPLQFRPDDGSESLFDQSEVLNVELTMSSESYASIAAEAKPEGTSYPYVRDYYSTDVSLNGENYSGAGARVKGAGTARPLQDKSAFKIHLAWDDPSIGGCPEERRFKGLKKITLNNMIQDESHLRETLGYQFYEALGLKVPRTQFAKVSVNQEHYGRYLHVESVDRRFLARRFENRKGMLYEAIYGGGRNCDVSPEKLVVPAANNCFKESFNVDECDGSREGYDPGGHVLINRLGQDIGAIPEGQFYQEIGNYIDIEEYLHLVAAEIVGGAGDSHVYHHNNYRIYHDPSDQKWHFIPTGIDISFSHWLPPGADQEAPVAYLAQQCLSDAQCVSRLVEVLENALDVFDAMDFESRMDSLVSNIESAMIADPKAEATQSEVEQSRNRLRQFIRTRRERVQELIEAWQ